jgi:Galactose oxidase, central domain
MSSFVWAQRQNMGPSPRANHDMVFYPESGKFILFGGGDGGSGETWEWDGELWYQVADTGPAPRDLHAMAYDSKSKRILLFGGSLASGNAGGDTWAWDGTWIQVEDSGPPACWNHAMTGDPVRQRVVLHGGIAVGWRYLGDTWEWDGEQWLQVDNSGPAARSRAAMAYDAAGGRVVLFGGEVSDPATWAWNGIRWVQIAHIGPGKRAGHAVCPTEGGVLLFGGNEFPGKPGTPIKMLNDTWLFSSGRWRQIQDIGPAPRTDLAMDFDPVGKVFLFGGAANADRFGDTWELVERS